MSDWVVAGGKRGELGHCTRCGNGLNLGGPQLLFVAAAAMKAFAEVHSRCEPGQYLEPTPKTPEEWREGRDTGISSITIYDAATGRHSGEYDVPHDPEDFGRCYRLLKLFPVWRAHLSKTVDLRPQWRPFVEAWNELTALYEEELPSGKLPKLYARIQELHGK